MPSSSFDVVSYNKTLLIHEADERFEKQLASARITRREFFSHLAPLFMEDEIVGRYAICLIHRHHLLDAGERVVADGNSSRPSKDVSDNIVPETWLSTGEAFEYRYTSSAASLPPPPSADFFAKFKSITDLQGINTLGVCYAPSTEELPSGHIYLEEAGTLDRERVTNIAPIPSWTDGSYGAIWVARRDSQGQFEMFGICECTNGCKKRRRPHDPFPGSFPDPFLGM